MAAKRKKSLGRRLAKLTRPLRYRLTFPFLEACRLIVSLMPYGMILWLGRWMGRVARVLSAGKRRLAERQMTEAKIAGDRRAVHQLGRRMFESLATNGLEWMHSDHWNEQTLRRRIECTGLENFHQSVAHGKGAIFLTGHLGNWELMLRAYRTYTGRSLMVVMAEMRNPQFNRWIIRMREAGGHQLLPSDVPLITIVRHLKQGGLLAILADQDSTRGRGIFVDFFGRPAYTPVGPAHLAYRTRTAIVPVTMLRDADNPRRHHFQFHEPIHADPTAEAESEFTRITQTYTHLLEKHIRFAPAQWVWLHNRWRHRPGQRIRVRSAGGKLKQT